MSLPQENATVVKVTASVSTYDDRDDFESARNESEAAAVRGTAGGAVKWTGSERAYLTDEVLDALEGDGPNVVKRRTLVVLSSWARALGVDTDDVIFMRTDALPAVTIQAKANVVAVRELPGFNPSFQTARLDLEILVET